MVYCMLNEIKISTLSHRYSTLSDETFNSLVARIFEKKLSIEDALMLLTRTTESQFLILQNLAAKIRDKMEKGVLSYSRNVFIPITFLCRNFCFYCTFRKSRVPEVNAFLSPKKVLTILETAKKANIVEILFTNGEKAELRYDTARKWLKKHGYASTNEYLYDLGHLTLKMGLLPHMNPGSLTYEELKAFKEVNASMGLMLENLSARLSLPKMPHYKAPDKHPRHRIRTLSSAGKLGIPWTTGLLIGIGETPREIVQSLFFIKRLHAKYQHIQEVILQNFVPKPRTAMASWPSPPIWWMKRIVVLARLIFFDEIPIQVPPNLVSGHEAEFIRCGIADWGGISPLTHDYVNPHQKWPRERELEEICRQFGYTLRRRLPVYPKYVNARWLHPNILQTIENHHLATEDFYSNV